MSCAAHVLLWDDTADRWRPLDCWALGRHDTHHNPIEGVRWQDGDGYDITGRRELICQADVPAALAAVDATTIMP